MQHDRFQLPKTFEITRSGFLNWTFPEFRQKRPGETVARRGGAQLGPVFAGHGWLQGGLAIGVKYGKKGVCLKLAI
jgi:hypothetical protein